MLRQIAQRRINELKKQRSDTDSKQNTRHHAQTKKMEALFKVLFADLLPHINREGIEISIRPNPYLDFSCFVEFSKDKRQWRMELSKSGAWRYRPDQCFGQWPKEDLAVALVENLFGKP